MNFVPAEIKHEEIVKIANTKWSFLQHTPTLQLFFHDDYPSDGKDSYHVSVFYRPVSIDIHATFLFYCSRDKRWKRRHHGWCLVEGKQESRINRRPFRLPKLFEKFQNDIHLLLDPCMLRHIPVQFFGKLY